MRLKPWARKTAALAAVLTAWTLGTAAMAPSSPAAAAPVQTDLQVQSFACWVEKTHSVDSAEVICGRPDQRPADDTADIGQDFGPAAHRWVAVLEGDGTFDIVPSSTN